MPLTLKWLLSQLIALNLVRFYNPFCAEWICFSFLQYLSMSDHKWAKAGIKSWKANDNWLNVFVLFNMQNASPVCIHISLWMKLMFHCCSGPCPIQNPLLWCSGVLDSWQVIVVHLLQNLYVNSTSCLRILSEVSEEFSIRTCVRQGDITSPLWFNTLIIAIMRSSGTSREPSIALMATWLILCSPTTVPSWPIRI